jgi:ferredoxin
MFSEGGLQMTAAITINTQSCKACGTCADVCPNKIMHKAEAKITFREDRVGFCIKCGQCMAVCPTRSIQVSGLSYEKDFFPLAAADSYENVFFDMIGSRRAIRNFKDQVVPRELLEKVVTAISYAPPSFPPIKTEVIVVQKTSVIRQALPTMIEMYDTLVRAMGNPIARNFVKKGAGAEKFRVLEKHVLPLMKNRLPELKAGTEDTITRHAPAMIIFHADKSAENYHPDIYIAMTYGILAAHALGLGATMIDLIAPAIEREKKLRKLFSIPAGNEVVASMILGYPKYKYQRGIKRQLKSVNWI